MKIKLKFICLFAVLFGLFNGCETTDLDKRVSPNDLASDQADPNLLLNSVQLAYVTNVEALNEIGSDLTRIEYMFGRDYFNNYPGATMNGVWSRTYSSGTNGPGAGVGVGIFTNVANLQSIDEGSDIDYSFHIAVGKTLQAHMLMLLVDYMGKAVFSQAGNPDEFPAPMLDEGPAVYQSALGLLDEAEDLFETDPATQGAVDFFYEGDNDKWIKLVNTLRLNAAFTTRDSGTFNSIIDEDNYISSIEDDFQFQYGSRELQPDTRHPDYAADYTPSGANIYQSNWLMEYMLNQDDPRRRYYFYRQQSETPGADAPPNEETLACSLVVPPQHYQDGDFIYCSVGEGYWGRSHGNDEGTPPDNFLRTAVGVYPAGGKFDDDDFGVVGLGLGGGGAGIEPIILSSYVYFWRAEMASGDGDDDGAGDLMETALKQSLTKVRSFASLDGDADPEFVNSDEDDDEWIEGIVSDYDSASGDDKKNILAQQYFVTLYGDGTHAYNYYRKTGFPTTLYPNWERNPGPFPRSLLYPNNEVINNPNLMQKADLTEQVFWDNNPSSPTFPIAN